MQLSLLPSARLFAPPLRRQYLDNKQAEQIPGEAERVAALRNWVNGLEALNPQVQQERGLEQAFNQSILCDVLGYRLIPDDEASAWPKPPTSATQIPGEPDVVLGAFKGEPNSFMAVVELKKPGTDFDKPQSRADRKSPVEQAFEYASSLLGVKWVLVSDLQRLRLYSVENPTGYEAFDLSKCIDSAGSANEEFRRLYFFLNHDFLVGDGRSSGGLRLLAHSTSRQVKIRDAFYEVYFQIRYDLLAEMRRSISSWNESPSDEAVIEAAQRLLDRMMFIFYCEDHPDQLIPPGTVKEITAAARRLPGSNNTRVYDAIKGLFREVDTSSPPGSGVHIAGYNGELFKPHPIVDTIDLPDSLHDRQYTVEDPDGGERIIGGAWGLHVFDFWQELNEHLLGHIFEESLSDVVQMAEGNAPTLAEKLEERKRHGIYFTDQILADYLSRAAIDALLREKSDEPPETDAEMQEWLTAQIDQLGSLRIIDTACGSGAFLVSSYREVLKELWRLQDLKSAVAPRDQQQLTIDPVIEEVTQRSLLRSTLHGVDLLPQAVEIAKLALWLRSARKDEKIGDLTDNLLVGDSLDVPALLKALPHGEQSFDLVVGNPPWGAKIDQAIFDTACATLGLDPRLGWDSWELFVALALKLLKDGGRLSLVLPDTIFSPEKGRIREILLTRSRIERFHNLGPDWFGPNVRMGTTVLIARKGTPPLVSDFNALLLTGESRRKAQSGEIPLSQLEASHALRIPQERSSPEGYSIEIFRSRRDDEVIATIEQNSIRLVDVCTRSRGEEMSKAGLLWICPSCQIADVPGTKRKGGGYNEKTCQSCGFALSESNTQEVYLVSAGLPEDPTTAVPFIDGDDISHRYTKVTPDKKIRLDLQGFPYKDKAIYHEEKLLIRQAGVGLWVTLDQTGARCPQSVYIYRVKHEQAGPGYSNLFVLAALSSRTMAYYIFKRFGEVDPARAHVKMTHKRLEDLPIPVINPDSDRDKALLSQIEDSTAKLLDGGAVLGGAEDLRVELALRKLWGLSGDDGAYINGQFSIVPTSQMIEDLFPDGPPRFVPNSSGTVSKLTQ